MNDVMESMIDAEQEAYDKALLAEIAAQPSIAVDECAWCNATSTAGYILRDSKGNSITVCSSCVDLAI